MKIFNKNDSKSKPITKNDPTKSDDKQTKIYKLLLLRRTGTDVPTRNPIQNNDTESFQFQVWCDWMLLHKNIWNPPPFCLDYKIGATANHDPWNGLSNLMTLLEKFDTNKNVLSAVEQPGMFITLFYGTLL